MNGVVGYAWGDDSGGADRPPRVLVRLAREVHAGPALDLVRLACAVRSSRRLANHEFADARESRTRRRETLPTASPFLTARGASRNRCFRGVLASLDRSHAPAGEINKPSFLGSAHSATAAQIGVMSRALRIAVTRRICDNVPGPGGARFIQNGTSVALPEKPMINSSVGHGEYSNEPPKPELGSGCMLS